MKMNILKRAVSMLAIVSVAGTTLPVNVPVSKAENMEAEESYIIMTERQNVSDQIADNYEGEQLEENSKVISAELTKTEVELLDSKNDVVVEKDFILEGSNIESADIESIDASMPIAEGQIDHPWNMEAIGVTANDQNPRKVKVELLDSGVSAALDIEIAENVDLVHKADEGYNPLFMDDNGHGTALAGVMCAKDDDSGIVGINPNMELYSVKALDANNQSPLSRIIEGIYWGIEHDVAIINMSFGTTKDSEILHQAVQDAAKHGIMMVAAAGNSMHKEVQYPAAYSEVIAVGSVGTDGKLAEETAVGTSLELLAPGEEIITNGFYSIPVVAEGTSIATAQVTGVASLLYDRVAEHQNDIVRAVLTASAKKVPVSDNNTAGLIDYNCATELFQDYVEAYNNNDQEAYICNNDKRVQDYTEMADEQVYGLWGETAHKEMASAPCSILSTPELVIVRKAASKPDESSIKKGAAAELHGAGNYVAHLKYLWYLSVYLGKEDTKGTDAGVTTAIKNARKNAKAKLAGTKVATSGKAGNSQYQHLVDSSGDLIRASLESGDYKTARQLQLIVWGYASHLIGDVYAHRTVIPASTPVHKSSILIKNQFRIWDFENFNGFQSYYTKGTMEYRWMKKFCRDYDNMNKYYIDSLSFFENRGKNATKCVSKFIKNSIQGQGTFSVAAILPSEFPQNSKIANLKTYCKDAGVSTADVKASYTAETEEPEL